MDQRTVKLLTDWGFSAYIQSFKYNEIDYEGLINISRESSKQLFNGKLGPVDKLERRIREHVNSGAAAMEIKVERPDNDVPTENVFPIKMEEVDLGVSDWRGTAPPQTYLEREREQLCPKHHLMVPLAPENPSILLKIGAETDQDLKETALLLNGLSNLTSVSAPQQAKGPLKPNSSTGSSQLFISNQKRKFNNNGPEDLLSPRKKLQHDGEEADFDDRAQAGSSGLQNRVLSQEIPTHQLDVLHSKMAPERRSEGSGNQCESLHKNVVETYLQKTCVGNGILRLSRNKLLDAPTRVKLCHEIVVNELGIQGSNVIGRRRFEVLAECIVNLFTREIKDTYYIPRLPANGAQKAVQPKGILYDKYHNLLKFLRQTGLRSSVQQEPSSADDFDTDPPSPNFDKDIEWLENYSTECQPTATKKWKATARWRIDYLRNCEDNVARAKIGKDSIDKYFQKFRCLNLPWGTSLLMDDFAYLYGSQTASIVDSWPTIYAKLLVLANKTEANIGESDVVKCLQLIPSFFNQPLIWSGSKQTGTTWRPNAAESRDGFLLHVEDISTLEAKVKKIKEKCTAVKKTLQPFPVVVGSTTRKRMESYVVLGDKRIPMESPLSAVDTCFKMCHALHCYYPCQSSYSWLFVQQALYNITTAWDFTPPSVITKVKEFKEISL